MNSCAKRPHAAAVIPARMASTRFPGKVLAVLGGKPIIQHVWEQAKKSSADEVIVATDSQEVVDCVTAFGGKACLTRADHPSGSDRVWEAASHTDAEVIINVQGDEPFVEPSVIDQLIELMCREDAPDMATAVVPEPREKIADNPNCVKAVLGNDGSALYFSRAPIPFLRTGGKDMTLYRHWGIYAYTRKALKKFVSLPEGKLEQCEKLEQLRALENGMKIKAVIVPFESIGIDTPEDLKAAEEYLKSRR